MEGTRDKKNVRPILIIIIIALLSLFNNGVIGRRTIITNTTSFRPSSFQQVAIVPSSFTKDLDRNDTCIEQPNLPLSRGHFFSSDIDYANLTKITADSSEAICMYDRTQDGFFPHAMQQLYGCFSFWREFPTKQPILVVYYVARGRLLKQRFTRGVLEMLQSQMSLEIVNSKWLERRSNNGTEKPFVVHSNGYDVKHYEELQQYTAAHLKLKDTSSGTCTKEKPRIGIVNRADYKWRSILNADELVAVARPLSRDNFIRMEYFENQSFPDQVAFFRSVDILIAPHGAQLTGVAFMDAPCSHLLEVFPKHYVIPHFYGSLAMSTGKKYSYLYMSENSFLLEQVFKEREVARRFNFCPSIATIVGYLKGLVADWKECCTSIKLSQST
mmetsp:Transcript_33078/g.79938  ORF Transcript_33078/g.79938 Transcript_33078/m.79938 type:complete len:385 (+) Transcript_33078:80-1234(+)